MQGLFESRLRTLQYQLDEYLKKDCHVLPKSIKRSHLTQFHGKTFISDMYYLSLPFVYLNQDSKNKISGVIRSFHQQRFKDLYKNEIRYRITTFQTLPPETLEHCLEVMIPNNKEAGNAFYRIDVPINELKRFTEEKEDEYRVPQNGEEGRYFTQDDILELSKAIVFV
jgi:hypothetical protein